MKASLRIVNRLPLEELWDEHGDTSALLVRAVGKEEIRTLLRLGPVRFVVANVGDPLKWVEAKDRFQWWKEELKPHLAEPEVEHFYQEDWPDEYFYTADEWRRGEEVFVVARMWH